MKQNLNHPKVSPGNRFRNALREEKPLQIAGTINAYCALLAESAGFHGIYLSGAGVANASFGLPDLGITTLHDVLEDARRITSATNLPLLVDIDTGWGSAFNITRTIKEMIKVNVAAIHMEDQVQAKRCGHRPGKVLVTATEMVDRLRCAVDARTDPDFVIMARTDAYSIEGLNAAIERANLYLHAGADMIFAEAISTLTDYQIFCRQVQCPVLANITEFGKTPMFTVNELAKAGVSLVLYPLTAFRAMSKSALEVYQTLRQSGTQQDILNRMQTRDELYRHLDYLSYEQKLDALLNKEHEHE